MISDVVNRRVMTGQTQERTFESLPGMKLEAVLDSVEEQQSFRCASAIMELDPLKSRRPPVYGTVPHQ